MQSWFEDDHAWCFNSAKGECDKTTCWRHNFNRIPPITYPDIATWGCFKNTLVCPYFNKEKNDNDDI